MPGNPYYRRRPGGVTFVIVLTWVAAIASLASGLLVLRGSHAGFDQIHLDRSTAQTYAWFEIGFGVAAGLVAIGLAVRSGLARGLVTVLMVVRLAAAIWTAFAAGNADGRLASVGIGIVALVVLSLLWSTRADAWFRGA